MTTYSISLDLICNLEGDDIISILYRLINKECEHTIAVDSKMKLLKAFVSKAKRPNDISSWISLLSDTMNYTPVSFEFDENNIQDADILLMTARIVGSKKMIVSSLQSIDYTEVNSHNEAVVEGAIVPFVTKKVAIQEINHSSLQINYNNSQIAMNGSSISKSKIEQS